MHMRSLTALNILILKITMYIRAHETYPIKYREVHVHLECLRPKVDALRDVQQHLVVQGLHPESVSALKVCKIYSAV